MVDEIASVIGPRLNIVRRHNSASGGEDLTYIRKKGVPVASLAQDGTTYFDYHHTENDTLDKIDPEALQQNVAAFAAFVYLAANYVPTDSSSPKDPSH
jgi:Zn-dependent M28 family amino/carboxypeptidase